MSARLLLEPGETAEAMTNDNRRVAVRGARGEDGGGVLVVLPRVRYSLRVEPSPPEAFGCQGELFLERGLLVVPAAPGPDGLVRSVVVLNLSERSVRVAHGTTLLSRQVRREVTTTLR